MKKFYVLVKKEIKELLTPQMIVPLLAMMLLFVFIGKVVGKQITSTSQANSTVAVLDLDNSKTSASLEQALIKNRFNVQTYKNISIGEVMAAVKKSGSKSFVVIPNGFEQLVNSGKTVPLTVYTTMDNFSFTSSRNSQNLAAAITVINQDLSNAQIAKLAPKADASAIKQPVKEDDYVIIGNNQAHISPAAVSGYISSQTTFIPIILLLVIVFAAQMITTSIASEKENKTLETLLSSPINRQAIVAAKLVGAGLVALLTSAIYLIGMRSYINGLSTGGSSGLDASAHQAISQLGIMFNTTDYIMLGISLFFGILVALAIALIFGSFAQDAKSAQGVVTPVMMLVLIPYFLILFLDINTLSPALKYLVYAIPFSHPFLAAPNLMLHQFQNVWLGIIYCAVLFIIFVFIAARIFSSDKILTLKLNFRRGK